MLEVSHQTLFHPRTSVFYPLIPQKATSWRVQLCSLGHQTRTHSTHTHPPNGISSTHFHAQSPRNRPSPYIHGLSTSGKSDAAPPSTIPSGLQKRAEKIVASNEPPIPSRIIFPHSPRKVSSALLVGVVVVVSRRASRTYSFPRASRRRRSIRGGEVFFFGVVHRGFYVYIFNTNASADRNYIRQQVYERGLLSTVVDCWWYESRILRAR